MEAPTIPVRIAAGDFVQATHVEVTPGDEPDNVTVATFTVKNINPNGVVTGSPILGPLNPKDGWVVELITKAPANVALPETIAELAVWTRTNEVKHVMGKKGQWRDAVTGREVPAEMIHGWTEWGTWEVRAEAYRKELRARSAERRAAAETALLELEEREVRDGEDAGATRV